MVNPLCPDKCFGWLQREHPTKDELTLITLPATKVFPETVIALCPKCLEAFRGDGKTRLKIRLDKIQPHPLQDSSRMADTTRLQDSQAEVGVLYPPTVAPIPNTDGFLCLAGHRTVTAARQRGTKEIVVMVRDGLSEIEQVTIFCHANIHEKVTHSQQAATARWLLNQGKTPKEIATIMCVSRTQVHYLTRLAEAPEEIRKLVSRGDKGQDDGLTWGAFKEIATLSPEEMVERIKGGTSRKEVRRAKLKAGVGETDQPQLFEDATHTLELITDMRGASGEILAFLRTASPQARALIFEALQPLMDTLGDIYVLRED